MSFDDFKKQMEELHKRNVQAMGPTERLVLQEDVKLWHITATIVRKVDRTERFRWPDIVPVTDASGTVIGAASILPSGDNLMAQATVDYNTPERLDYENGRTLFLYGEDEGITYLEDLYEYEIPKLVLTDNERHEVIAGGLVYETP